MSAEVEEETGWRLRTVRRLIGVSTWEGDDGQGLCHEADFVVEDESGSERLPNTREVNEQVSRHAATRLSRTGPDRSRTEGR